jgi:hypothetical protein
MLRGEALMEVTDRDVIQLDHVDIGPVFVFELFAALGSFIQGFRHPVPFSFSCLMYFFGLPTAHDEKESSGG